MYAMSPTDLAAARRRAHQRIRFRRYYQEHRPAILEKRSADYLRHILLTLDVAKSAAPLSVLNDMRGKDVLNDISELPALPGQQLFSRRTLAAMLDVSIETVSRRIKMGDIKAIKVGNRLVRIPRSEVERLLSPNSDQAGEL